MSKVISFSRTYPAYHSKKGQPTYFVEKFWKSLYNMGNHDFMDYEGHYTDALGVKFIPEENIHNHKPKGHTIRAGLRWNAGDYFSPRVWGEDINPKSGRKGAYHSKQVILAPDVEIKRVHTIHILPGHADKQIFIDGNWACNWNSYNANRMAENDGLTGPDMHEWFTKSPDFKKSGDFLGQIIIWDDKIKYPLI